MRQIDLRKISSKYAFYNQMLKLFFKNKIKVWINFPYNLQLNIMIYLKKIINFKIIPFITYVETVSKSDDLFSEKISFFNL